MGSFKSNPQQSEEIFSGPPANSGDNSFERQRPLPLDRSVFWYPAKQGAEPHRARAYLRFITLGALREIHQQVAARPKEGRLGFLTGDLFICPDTNARYVVVDSTTSAPLPVRGDRTLQAVTLAWPRLQEQLNVKRRRLLGWYHTHPEGGLELTASDVTTHLRYFPRPWQMAIVLKPRADEPLGVICRPGAKGSVKSAVLPFYELLEPQSLLAEGVRTTYFRWNQYRTDAADADQIESSTSTPIALPKAQFDDDVSGARVILPEELDYAVDSELNGVFHAPTRRRALLKISRFAAAAAIVLASAFALWKFVLEGRPPVEASNQTGQTVLASQIDPTLARLDQLADDVAAAVSGYRERARLFDNRQMTCADLARGMAQADEQWTAYNADGRSKAGTLDPERAERDETLYGDVQDVERHFRASGCPAI